MKIANAKSMLLVLALVVGVYATIVVGFLVLDGANDSSASLVSAQVKPSFRSSLAETSAARQPTTLTLDSAAFEHTSHWERVAGLRDGRFHGSSLRSFFGGALARVAFTGAGIRLYGIVGRGGGVGVVSIDGRLASNANFYAARKATHRRVFESAPLARGPHVLVIEVALSSAPREHRRYVNLDEVEIVR